MTGEKLDYRAPTSMGVRSSAKICGEFNGVPAGGCSVFVSLKKVSAGSSVFRFAFGFRDLLYSLKACTVNRNVGMSMWRGTGVLVECMDNRISP